MVLIFGILKQFLNVRIKILSTFHQILPIFHRTRKSSGWQFAEQIINKKTNSNHGCLIDAALFVNKVHDNVLDAKLYLDSIVLKMLSNRLKSEVKFGFKSARCNLELN